ncbi:MAG: MBL fold metallo-hydrolase [Gemmatimonadetes bacterium]|nr:MBL fold metallo-hydrolase [Gemmatimonadota bacterium]
MKKSLASVALVAALAWTPQVPDAKAVIAAASKAMGVEALRTIQYSATGFDYALGQSAVPGGPWPKFAQKSYTRAVSFDTPASRVDRVRIQAEDPPRGGGAQPIRGDQPQSQTIVVGQNTPWVQQLEIWMLPHGFLRAAAARNATLETKTVDGKRYSVLSFTGDNKAKVNGYINAQNHVERVETWIDHPVMGDMAFETLYSEYQTIDGVQFPMHMVQKQGGHPIFDLALRDVKINAPVSIQMAQGGGGGGGGGGGALATQELAPGVFLLSGGYAQIAIDAGDHILMLEPGNSEQRALASIAEAKKLIPGKPIRYVLNTHSHYDHSSGLRAFVAEGATIITHETNVEHLKDVLGRPHTLNPDAQEKAKQPLKVEVVKGDKKVIQAGRTAVELHLIKNFLHHPGMLMAYIPSLKLLYEADGFNANQPADAPVPPTPSPYNLALLDNIARLKLDVERVIPVHYPADGRVVTLTEINRQAGK